MTDENLEGHSILQDAEAQSAAPDLPAFLAPPDGVPPYYGFPIVPETETDGWLYGAITAWAGPEGCPSCDPDGCIAGDGFVQAPDGSRAGLVWGPDETHMEEYVAPQPDRWGVYAIRFPRPVKSVEDIVYNFRAVLPDLQRKYAEVMGK